jgi:glycosyltransferase involved in cell wall biosynthesis
VKDSITIHKNLNVCHETIKVSIITPVYNAGIYIEGFLQSLQNQTYKNWEVLFLNNYSKDDTAKIIKKYAIRDPRIKLITDADNGIYDAMNKGVLAANGDWLCFQGADDCFYDNTVLEIIFKESYLDDADIVYGDVCWVPLRIC